MNYNFHGGSNTNLKQVRGRVLASPTVSPGMGPFKNGTQLCFKGEALHSPQYQSDHPAVLSNQNNNVKSLSNIPRNETAAQSEAQPAPQLVQKNSGYVRDSSTKDTQHDPSAGINSAEMLAFKNS